MNFTIKNVGAISGGDAFLITTPTMAAVFDTGFAYCAEEMVENLRRELGDRPLDYILLTHSHYDHASGAPYCKAAWPNAKVVAGEYATKIFAKPSARAFIRDMNDSAAREQGVTTYTDRLEDLSVDIPVKEGDVLQLGEMTFTVLNTPGHTKCSVSFFCQENGLLLSSETSGVFDGKEVYPCYLVGYQMTLDSIEKMVSCNPKNLVLPHVGLLSEADSQYYLQRAPLRAAEAKDDILRWYGEGLSFAEIKRVYKEKYYTPENAKFQPEKAFDVNLHYIVKLIVQELLGEDVTLRA